MKPDTLWEIVEGCETFESFCKGMVPAFQNDDRIPNEIRRKLERIQKLIAHSYYEYDFIDVALLQAFHTLEFALHLKYKSVYPNKKGLENLKPHLDWAVRVKYISLYQNKMISELRNHLAHQKEESVMGTVGVRFIKAMVELISNLFIIY